MKNLYFLLILILPVLFFSCQKQLPGKTKILNISFNQDPPTLDPRKSGDYISSSMLFMLFRGLMHMNQDGSLSCSLADSYEISSDGKTYTFHLRDAKWSDGMPITAYDFENSWKKILDPAFPSFCKHLFYPIKNAEKTANGLLSIPDVGIKAIDAKTLIVNLENPTPYFLALTSFCVFFPIPTHIENRFKDWSYNLKHFVSSGPFNLTKYKRNSFLLVEKNPKFFGAEKIKIDGIKVHIIFDENTVMQMYEMGKLDWLSTFLSPLSVDQMANLLKRSDCFFTPIGGCSFLTFNNDQFPFNNVKMRKAFALAVNRKEIVENITQLNEAPASRLISPVLIQNQNKELIKDNDIETAKQLFYEALNELTISKESLDITLSYGSIIIHKKEAEIIAQTWKKTFGIDIKLKMIDEKSMLSLLHAHNYMVAMGYLVVQYNDPMNIFERFKYKKHPKNYANWENKEFISLLDLSMTISDQQSRKKVLEKAEELFISEMPIAPLYHYNYVTLVKPHVKGVYIGSAADLHFDNTELISQK